MPPTTAGVKYPTQVPTIPDADLEAMTKADLIELAGEHNVSGHGTKAEIIARLRGDVDIAEEPPTSAQDIVSILRVLLLPTEDGPRREAVAALERLDREANPAAYEES